MTAKKATGTRPAKKQGQRARAKAPKKGEAFENQVAEIFRLLGAEVTQNVQVCNKKVDILATYRVPGGRTDHRVIVECKDVKKPQAMNQLVMQFQGLLDTARKAGDAESAEIVTRTAWSDEAKGFALKSGVSLLTIREKLAQLIDFSPYLAALVESFEEGDPARPAEPPLGAYYVDVNIKVGQEDDSTSPPLITDYVQEWLADNGRHHLAVMGEFGTGKSSFCLNLVHILATQYLSDPGSCRIPILLNLRDFTKSLQIESLVSTFLDQQCGVQNPRYRLFREMSDAGMLLVIMDGFDEMANRVDVDTLEANLQELEKLAGPQNSKVILTSRIELFSSATEQKSALRPTGELLRTRNQDYEAITILPWNPTQVETFIENRVRLIPEAQRPWEYYRDQIQDIPELTELSERPVLLDMIVRTLPELLARNKPINRPNLYETYLQMEIRRQKIQKKRELLLSEKIRFVTLSELALKFFDAPDGSFTFTDALELVEAHANPPKGELEHYTRDFLTCSFLVRTGDEFRFSHNSIMEYLVAKALDAEIVAGQVDYFRRCRITPVVAAFLSDLSGDPQRYLALIRSTRNLSVDDAQFIGGNAATVACHIDPSALAGQNLTGTVLRGANMASCDLRGCNFRDAVLTDVDLTDAAYTMQALKRAKKVEASISIAVIANAEGLQQRYPERSSAYRLEKWFDDLFGQVPLVFVGRLSEDPHPSAWLGLSVTNAAQIETAVKQIRELPEIEYAAVFAAEWQRLYRRYGFLPPVGTFFRRAGRNDVPHWLTADKV